MSAPTWQFARPQGVRLAIVVIGGVVAIVALLTAAMRLAELYTIATESQSQSAPPQGDPNQNLLLGRRAVTADRRSTTAESANLARLAADSLRETRIVSSALRHVRRRYVDPDRIDPPRMLEASLQAIAHAMAEVLLEVEGRDGAGRPTAIVVRVDQDTLRIDCLPITDLFRLDWAIHRVVAFLVARLPQQALEAHLEYVAVNGLLDTLDPYSAMLDPDAWQEMQTHTGGQFGGLGIRVLTRAGVLTVVGIIPRSPAQRAGLRANDQILRINGEDTLNMRIDDAVDRLRGKVGSAANLLIGRKSWKKPRPVRVVRAVIQLTSVEGRRLPGDVVYARIKNFQRGTAAELRKILAKTVPGGLASGLVLDLRSNPGGLLDEAVKVCDLLIRAGPVVITVAGGGRDREVRSAHADGTLAELPVVVLVNRRSASASEIVAGALKESNRAVIIGERTWGKGTVQVPFEIGDGALKLTIAKYLVPGDVSIQDVGVTPDIALRFVDVRRGHVALYAPRSRRERRKPWAHKADRTALARRPVHRLRLLLPVRRTGAETAAQFREQAPIRRATALLDHAADPQAAVMLAQTRAWIDALHTADGEELRARLQKLGVDWRIGEQPTSPRVRLEIEPVKGGLTVEAGRSIRLPIRVHNRGKTPLFRVHVFTRSNAPALDGVEQVIGRLDPGQSRLVQVRLRPSRRHLDLIAPVEVVVALDGKPLPVTRAISLRVRGLPRPRFAWKVTLLEQPNTSSTRTNAGSITDDGMISAGETVRIRVQVRNVGQGKAARVVASLRSLAGRLLRLKKGRVRLGELKPGQTAEAVFTLRGVKALEGRKTGLLAARLEIVDGRLGTRRSERITLPWRGQTPSQGKIAEVIKASQVTLNHWTQPPLLTLTAQSLAAKPLSWPCTLQLTGQATFESVLPGRRYLSVSVGGAKRAFVAGRGRKIVDFALPVTLDKGLNRITILARSGRQQVAYQQVLVHCRAASPTLGGSGAVAKPKTATHERESNR